MANGFMRNVGDGEERERRKMVNRMQSGVNKNNNNVNHGNREGAYYYFPIYFRGPFVSSADGGTSTALSLTKTRN
jgi:hypothetical protein